jgi:hypothetical protein
MVTHVNSHDSIEIPAGGSMQGDSGRSPRRANPRLEPHADIQPTKPLRQLEPNRQPVVIGKFKTGFHTSPRGTARGEKHDNTKNQGRGQCRP